MSEPTKLDIGGGRIIKAGFLNVDRTQFVDGNGDKLVDIVADIARDRLPFPDGSVDEVHADNVLEHIGQGFTFALNEIHRVLKEGGEFKGCVPHAGTEDAWKDPTHKRFFIKKTFDYFTGTNPAKPDRPEHPKYADYHFAPWNMIELRHEGDLIFFRLSPRKIANPPYGEQWD